MDGNGWKMEYGISQEGIEVLGYLEALPQEARREMAEYIAKLCKAEGYTSLQDGLGALMERMAAQPEQAPGELANVIPLFKGR
jgi:hypothetical protein